MKYALLLHNTTDDWERWEALTPEQAAEARAAEIPKWNALFERIGPRLVLGKELGERSDAKVVRVRDGETQVTDGPFAETKEVLGGLLVLDLEHLDDAIEVAKLIPLVERGAVEVRPLADG